MTDSRTVPTAGKYFVIYLTFGLVSLLSAMLINRFLVGEKDQKFFLSAAILLINFLTVWLYYAAIIRNKDLRSDPDAPDLAYYLGFCLTVGALSFSFLGDVGFSKLGNSQRGALVENALGQFGAGLLATLFGLCAKIFLNSKQAQEFSDPENLYSQLRGEVVAFRQTLRETGNDLASSVQSSAESIRAAGSAATQAMSTLASELTTVQQRISRELTADRITGSVEAFVDELEKLREPASAIAENVSKLSRVLQEVNKAISEVAQKSSEVNNMLVAQLQLGREQRDVVLEVVASNQRLLESQERVTTQSELASDAALTLVRTMDNLGAVLPKVAESLSEVDEQAKPAASQLLLLANATQSAIAPAHNLANSLSETKVNLDALGIASQSITEVAAQGENSARALRASLDGLVEALRDAEGTVARLTPTFGGNQDQAEQLEQQMRILTETFSRVVTGATSLQYMLNESSSSLSNLGANVESAITALSATPDALESFNRPLDSVAATTAGLNEGLANLTTQATDLALALRRVSDVERR
jgi:predicted  nucleic acid-binding Zn-ribbon protein